MKVFLYLHAGGLICRDSSRKPRLRPEEVGAARLVSFKLDVVQTAISELASPFRWVDGELAKRGYHLHQFGDGSIAFNLEPQ